MSFATDSQGLNSRKDAKTRRKNEAMLALRFCVFARSLFCFLACGGEIAGQGQVLKGAFTADLERAAVDAMCAIDWGPWQR